MRTRRDSHAARLIRPAAFLTLAAALLEGCSSAAPVPADNMQPPPGHGPYTGTVADWPLWFPWHSFGAYCFGVQSCTIDYAGHRHQIERPARSVESPEHPLEKVLHASMGLIPNFPPAARLSWIAADGTALESTVDMAKIFADRMILHPVAREDILEDTSIPPPGIIVVIDDRTVSVYMSTWIALKELRDPSNPHSNLHTGIILVSSQRH